MIGMAILALVVVFFAVVLIRAACFTPPAQAPMEQEAVAFDRKAAENALAALVKCRTVSRTDCELEDDAEF